MGIEVVKVADLLLTGAIAGGQGRSAVLPLIIDKLDRVLLLQFDKPIGGAVL
jgi:hypothetical protein